MTSRAPIKISISDGYIEYYFRIEINSFLSIADIATKIKEALGVQTFPLELIRRNEGE
jgi:hypothetical protein